VRRYLVAGWPRVIAHPGLPQIRTCRFPASGSSSGPFASYTAASVNGHSRGQTKALLKSAKPDPRATITATATDDPPIHLRHRVFWLSTTCCSAIGRWRLKRQGSLGVASRPADSNECASCSGPIAGRSGRRMPATVRATVERFTWIIRPIHRLPFPLLIHDRAATITSRTGLQPQEAFRPGRQ
jgi:hypothetical protein